MRCRSILKGKKSHRTDYFITYYISPLYPDLFDESVLFYIIIFEEVFNFFKIKKTYINEQLKEKIPRIVPKYIDAVKDALQDIVNVFCSECEVLPEGKEATFSIFIYKNNNILQKCSISFAITDIFDTIFLTVPIDDVTLDINLLKSVKLQDEPELIQIFQKMYPKGRIYQKEAFGTIREWNSTILRIKEELEVWLKYQKKLSKENLKSIIENKIVELKEVANYLRDLKTESKVKMKLNCFQFYILQGLLHELMHYFFHRDIGEWVNKAEQVENWVNVSANYIIEKLFDIRHLDILLPVVSNTSVEVESKIMTSFARTLQEVVYAYTQDPNIFRNFVENLPEEIKEHFQEKELDILLGNKVKLPNFQRNLLTKTITRIPDEIHITCPEAPPNPSLFPKIKETIHKILQEFNAPIEQNLKSIEDFLVYRESEEAKSYAILKEKPKIPKLRDAQLVDKETFERETLETLQLLDSFFTPILLRYLNKVKGFENKDWENKSIVKGMLYGTPFRRRFFTSTYGQAFFIIDISGSMEDEFIQFATSAVYSTLRRRFSRVNITIVQFANNINVKYYKNISTKQLFEIEPYISGGETRFSRVTNAIATDPRLRMEYNYSDFAVLLSDCDFMDYYTDFIYKIPLKPLVLFYPKDIEHFNKFIYQKPNIFPYNWLRKALVVDKTTAFNILRKINEYIKEGK